MTYFQNIGLKQKLFFFERMSIKVRQQVNKSLKKKKYEKKYKGKYPYIICVEIIL